MTCSLSAVNTTTWGGSRKVARGAMRAARVLPCLQVGGVKDGGGGGLFGAVEAHAVFLQDAVIQKGLHVGLEPQHRGAQLAAHLLFGQEQGAAFPGQGQGLAVALQVFLGKGQVRGERVGFPVEGDAHGFIGEVQAGHQVLGHGLESAHGRLRWFRYLWFMDPL